MKMIFNDFEIICWEILELFTDKVHIPGHMTRPMWDLKVTGESLGAVDNSRHWNFSIWSTNKGVMAILVEGYIPKKSINCMIMGPPQNDAFFALYPSI